WGEEGKWGLCAPSQRCPWGSSKWAVSPPQNTIRAGLTRVPPAATAFASAVSTSLAEVQFQASDIARKRLGSEDVISASFTNSSTGHSERITPPAWKNATPSAPRDLRRKPSAS